MEFKLIIDNEQPESVVVCAHAPSTFTDRLEALVREYSGQDTMVVFTEDEMRILPYRQIACFTVIDGKTWAIDEKGIRYRVKQRLYELEETVPASFFRINKSTLANEHQIERFTSTYSGGMNAIFRGGYEDYVSRRCFVTIKRRFQIK